MNENEVLLRCLTMGSNRDLRKYQEEDSIQDAFSKLVSGGKAGFKTIIEKKEPIFCPNDSCKTEIEGHEKFCPSCGTKIEKKSTSLKMCSKCYTILKPENRFCPECGTPKDSE
jgi:RNA polymerase subunit RPABC4/transcription elongation factor Spt4